MASIHTYTSKPRVVMHCWSPMKPNRFRMAVHRRFWMASRDGHQGINQIAYSILPTSQDAYRALFPSRPYPEGGQRPSFDGVDMVASDEAIP